jgi:hypothetical protein
MRSTVAGVRIGEEQNTVTLTHAEWNDFVARIRRGRAQAGLTDRRQPGRRFSATRLITLASRPGGCFVSAAAPARAFVAVPGPATSELFNLSLSIALSSLAIIAPGSRA